MNELRDKVAFVTGGASGIALGIAKAMVAAGMRVVIADVREDHLKDARAWFVSQKQSRRIKCLKLDVTNRKAYARAADQAEQAFGKVHVVCNNAGVPSGQAIDEADYEEWDWVMGINLGGVINGVKTFAPRIKKHGEGGHIVNTASMAGLIPLPADGGIYSATKFAVRGLTDSLRLSMAKHGVGVSCLCPGLTRSRIMSVRRTGEIDPAEGGLFNDMSDGMDPLELGEAVLAGIRANAPYILPHGEFKEEVRELFEEILDLFPEADNVPEGRLVFVKRRREFTEAAKRGEG